MEHKVENIGQPSDYDGAALVQAAADNDLARVMDLLDPAVDVDVNHSRDALRFTALTGAIKQGHMQMVLILESKGARLDQADGMGNTPLEVAILENRRDIIQFLMSRPVPVIRLCRGGNNPILHAASKGDGALLRRLHQAGALLDYHRPQHQSLRDDYTPLMCAAAAGHLDMVQLLLQLGADVNSSTSIGATALCLSAKHGRERVVTCLLDAGAMINHIEDYTGCTALASAAKARKVRVAQLLLTRGADPLLPITDSNFVSIASENGWLQQQNGSTLDYTSAADPAQAIVSFFSNVETIERIEAQEEQRRDDQFPERPPSPSTTFGM